MLSFYQQQLKTVVTLLCFKICMFILISLVKYVFVSVFSNAQWNLISLERKRHLGAVQQRCKIKTNNKQVSLTKDEEKLTSLASVSHPTYLFISTFTLIPLLHHASEIHHTSPLALSLSHLCLPCFLSLSCFLIPLVSSRLHCPLSGC